MPTTLNSWNADKCEPAMYPELAKTIAVKCKVSTTIAKGTLCGKVTATGLIAAYSNSNTDGTETAVGVMQYDIITDASGNHYLGDSAVPSEANLPLADVPMYISGIFSTADLVGEDSNAYTDLNARTLPNGHIDIPL